MPETSASNKSFYMRHRLAWLDQLAYELYRVTGRNQLMQCLWLYDQGVNLEALQKTIERLAALSFNRLIEPSVLPWGRPRWVKPCQAPAPINIPTGSLPRSQLLQWANRHARTPIDPVRGPAWRVAVQEFDDGTTAVSFLGSHLVLDGMGALRAIETAAMGIELPNPYLRQGARSGWAACMADALQILSDVPKTLFALFKIVQTSLLGPSLQNQSATTPPPSTSSTEHMFVDLPSVAVTLDLQIWQGCARRLGGRTTALLPAFVASLAAQMGRRRASDGSVSLLVPFNTRYSLNDDRAIAIEFRTMTITPDGLPSNLRRMDEPMKAVLQNKNGATDTLTLSLPAIAWMPSLLSKALVNQLFMYNDELPVSCSNLGTLPEGLGRIDGKRCTHVLTRAVDTKVTQQELDRSRGHLVVVASRFGKSISLCIEAYQPGPSPTTVESLRQMVEQTLADYGMQAEIEA